MDFQRIIKLLKLKGVEFDEGLSDAEIMQIEMKFDFQFPPDLRKLLQTELPSSKGFIHWRRGLNSSKIAIEIQQRIDCVFEGILFDIKYNHFWFEKWGNKPNNYEDKALIAKNNFRNYPKLIPIYGHRYISSQPYSVDNPIFSVYQTDIIYYGFNLKDYLINEFRLSQNRKLNEPQRDINFWTDLVNYKLNA